MNRTPDQVHVRRRAMLGDHFGGNMTVPAPHDLPPGYEHLRRAVEPFIRVVRSSGGPFNTKLLSAYDWAELVRAFDRCIPPDPSDGGHKTNLALADSLREFVNTHQKMMDDFVVRFESIYGKEKEPAIHNLSQDDFDNLVRDAMRWRSGDFAKVSREIEQDALKWRMSGIANAKPQMDRKVFDQMHGLREEFPDGPTPCAGGPNAADCNDILGKPRHYKDGPKDP